MPHYTTRLNKIIKGLKKASKLHASQAATLEKILEDQKHVKIIKKKRPESRNRKKTKG